MSTRPFFLRGYSPAHFAETDGHTLPAVASPMYAVPLQTSEGGARLDTRRVLPADDWLSDAELMMLHDERYAMGSMPPWRGQSASERAKREATRERLREVRDEFETTWREWALWAVALVVGIVGSAFFPTHWGYGLTLWFK